MEYQISKAIITGWFKKLENHLRSDAVIVGAGPSGLVCAAELAGMGYKVAVVERALAPGGGMWGGAMLFNQIVVQAEALHILQRYGIGCRQIQDGLYLADSAEATSALIYHAAKAGAAIFTGLNVEDVIITGDAVSGIVMLWTAVTASRMEVDPLTICAKAVLDSTGHPCEVVSILTKKNHIELDLPAKGVLHERSMNAAVGEKACVEYTGEVYPGLFVSGMAACGVSGSNRMGPIFGGMLLSGIKAADKISAHLQNPEKRE